MRLPFAEQQLMKVVVEKRGSGEPRVVRKWAAGGNPRTHGLTASGSPTSVGNGFLVFIFLSPVLARARKSRQKDDGEAERTRVPVGFQRTVRNWDGLIFRFAVT